jgi:hypothetical protein
MIAKSLFLSKVNLLLYHTVGLLTPAVASAILPVRPTFRPRRVAAFATHQKTYETSTRHRTAAKRSRPSGRCNIDSGVCVRSAYVGLGLSHPNSGNHALLVSPTPGATASGTGKLCLCPHPPYKTPQTKSQFAYLLRLRPASQLQRRSQRSVSCYAPPRNLFHQPVHWLPRHLCLPIRLRQAVSS